MELLTKFRILKPAHDVFEAFVDPERIGNFWFSSSSARWEKGKTIKLEYVEYNAKVEIRITDVIQDRKIEFLWGDGKEERKVTIHFENLESEVTIIEVIEGDFDERDPQVINKMVDNKEGWVYMLTCLKGYLEFDVHQLRMGMVK